MLELGSNLLFVPLQLNYNPSMEISNSIQFLVLLSWNPLNKMWEVKICPDPLYLLCDGTRVSQFFFKIFQVWSAGLVPHALLIPIMPLVSKPHV